MTIIQVFFDLYAKEGKTYTRLHKKDMTLVEGIELSNGQILEIMSYGDSFVAYVDHVVIGFQSVPKYSVEYFLRELRFKVTITRPYWIFLLGTHVGFMLANYCDLRSIEDQIKEYVIPYRSILKTDKPIRYLKDYCCTYSDLISCCHFAQYHEFIP